MKAPTAPVSPAPMPVVTPPVVDTTHPKWPWIIGGIVLLLLVGLGGIFLGKQTAAPAVSPTPTPIFEVSSNSWNTYVFKEAGLEFQIPASFGGLEEVLSPGEMGYSMNFKPYSVAQYTPNLAIGTTSIDYEQGRGGNFLDLQGFGFEDGKYYAKFVMGKTVDLPQNLVTKITNANGVEVLKISGKAGLDEGPSMMNSLGDRIGLLVNTKNKTYPGMTIAIKLTNGVTEDTVDQIISTFKFLDSNNQPYSQEGESCGRLAGQAGDAQCAPGLACKYQNPNNSYNEIGVCVK